MDSDSDSPFNYSWPSFPKMKIRRRASKKGRQIMVPFVCPEPNPGTSRSYPSAEHFPACLPACLLASVVRVFTRLLELLLYKHFVYGLPRHTYFLLLFLLL